MRYVKSASVQAHSNDKRGYMKRICCFLLCAALCMLLLTACKLSSDISKDVPLPKSYGTEAVATVPASVSVWDYSNVPLQVTKAYIEENFEASPGDALLWLHKEHGNQFCLDYQTYSANGMLLLYDYLSDPGANLATHSYDAVGNLSQTYVTLEDASVSTGKLLTFENRALVAYEIRTDPLQPDSNGMYEGSTAYYDADGVLTGSEHLCALPDAGTFRSITFDAEGKLVSASCKATKGSTNYYSYYGAKGNLLFYVIEAPSSVKYYNSAGKQITGNDVAELFPVTP